MFGEMKLRPILTPAEREENRCKWVEELQTYRIGICPIKDMDHLICTLEENAGCISDVMLDKEANDAYSSYLQATFDDTMDILDYLKSNKS